MNVLDRPDRARGTPRPWRRRIASPAAALAAVLVAAGVLVALPEHRSHSAKGALVACLAPGQRVARTVGERLDQARRWVACCRQSATELADAQEEIDRLRRENRRLADELLAQRTREAPPAEEPPRWLGVRAVPARVLGQQARAFLGRRGLLDVGAAAGVEPGSLVLEPPALVDRGSQAGVEPGALVLAGGRVWGKLSEVGQRTSTVRPITELGYRDLVCLVGPDGRGTRVQGVLEGTGERLARVRRVPLTQPVAVGDVVCSLAAEGLLDPPPVCGRVVNLQRAAGDACWDIWVEPSVPSAEVRQAVIVQGSIEE